MQTSQAQSYAANEIVATPSQLAILKTYFQFDKSHWSDEIVKSMQELTGLSEQQIHFWLEKKRFYLLNFAEVTSRCEPVEKWERSLQLA